MRSLTLMAALWSLATLACGLARNYEQMFLARLCVGIGEAAYGSVGIAVVLSVFPARLRATVTGAFMAGGMFGSVLGMAAGGVLAEHFGWRWSFAGMALFGLALAALYPFIVRESRIALREPAEREAQRRRARRRTQFQIAARDRVCDAFSDLRLRGQRAAALHRRQPDRLDAELSESLLRHGRRSAGVVSAAFVLCSGAGMIVCGIISDRVRQGLAAAQAVAGDHVVPALLRVALRRVSISRPVRSSSR